MTTDTKETRASASELEAELALGRNASIVKLVGALIEEAHARKASDIHMDPTREDLRVRLRVDGVLMDFKQVAREIQLEVVSRIKVLSGLRTDEHQAPQDGRFRHTTADGTDIDVRVSIAPTYYGENAVLRLLRNQGDEFALPELGYSPRATKLIESAIEKPNGMLLITGPTGSGKTTTLYTLIKMVNDPSVSIITIEDPIEYSIDRIEQIQVNARAGLTFATGLRSILRQDPDIIMVGEIRDSETAGIAVNTALTGHLLLSTLHTNDAATTLPRLIDMGIDAYLVASTVNVIIGQRLVRKICKHCKVEDVLSEAGAEALVSLGLQKPFSTGTKIMKGAGCDECGESGYLGRISINEVLVASPRVKEAILRQETAGEIKKIAMEEGMVPMLEDGMDKVRDGVTTIEEILRVIHE